MNLYVSSDRAFYTVQGEGPSMGRRAVFLRLAKCTLQCSFCDTLEVWKNSTPFSQKELYDFMEAKGFNQNLRSGARLVLTGGSPVLQQKALSQFLNTYYLRDIYKTVVECETEGVLIPTDLERFVSQWNVSPKLSNSGMSPQKRYIPEVLKWHACHNSIFKFPVTAANLAFELAEIQMMQAACGIKNHMVWLMPVCSTREALVRNSLPVVEACLKHGYNFSPRLQLLVWDQTTGV